MLFRIAFLIWLIQDCGPYNADVSMNDLSCANHCEGVNPGEMEESHTVVKIMLGFIIGHIT